MKDLGHNTSVEATRDNPGSVLVPALPVRLTHALAAKW
jgi:hypothetical protein